MATSFPRTRESRGGAGKLDARLRGHDGNVRQNHVDGVVGYSYVVSAELSQLWRTECLRIPLWWGGSPEADDGSFPARMG